MLIGGKDAGHRYIHRMAVHRGGSRKIVEGCLRENSRGSGGHSLPDAGGYIVFKITFIGILGMI